MNQFSVHTESGTHMQTRLLVARRSQTADGNTVRKYNLTVRKYNRNATSIRHMACSRCIKYAAYSSTIPSQNVLHETEIYCPHIRAYRVVSKLYCALDIELDLVCI